MNLMLLLSALPLVAVPSAPASAPGPPPPAPLAASPAGCDGLRPRIAETVPPVHRGIGDPSRTLRPRALDELPPGRLELAVLREVEGCVIPAVLREGIGVAPEAGRRR